MLTNMYFGMPITSLDDKLIETNLISIVSSSQKRSFAGYSLDNLYLMKMIPNLYALRSKNDYFLCDGRGFYFFAKFLGIKGVSSLSLPKLTEIAIKLAHTCSYSVYLLGAKGSVNLKAQDKLRSKYKVKSVFGRHGYYTIDEEIAIVQDINSIKPNILLLGMSSPKKDEFVFRWKDKLQTNIIIHCGGMLDIIAGEKKKYPDIIKNLGLAWLYRFLQEPIRLRRDFINLFPSLLIAAKIILLVKVFKVDYNYISEIKTKVD